MRRQSNEKWSCSSPRCAEGIPVIFTAFINLCECIYWHSHISLFCGLLNYKSWRTDFWCLFKCWMYFNEDTVSAVIHIPFPIVLFSVTYWPKSCCKIPMCGPVSIQKALSLWWRFPSLSLAAGLQLLHEKKSEEYHILFTKPSKCSFLFMFLEVI